MQKILYVVAVFAAGWGCSPRMDAPPGQSVPKLEPKSSVEFGELTFADEVQRRLLKRMDAEVREIADDSWVHESYWTRSDSYVVRARWTTPGYELSSPGGHSIVLSAYRHPDDLPNQILGVAAEGNWRPDASGWGAYVTYSKRSRVLDFSGVPDSFRVVFRWCPDGKFSWNTPTFEIYRDVAQYSARRQFEDTEYSFSVYVDPPTYRKVRVSDEVVLRWLRSPESLRDEALAKLDQLAAKAKVEIPSGAAVRGAHYVDARDGHGRQSLIARRQNASPVLLASQAAAATVAAVPPPDSYRPLSVEEKAIVLRESLAEIARRKELVRNNYEQLHAALERAFPLRKCLQEIE